MNKEEVKEIEKSNDEVLAEITVREMSGISLYKYYKNKEKEKELKQL